MSEIVLPLNDRVALLPTTGTVNTGGEPFVFLAVYPGDAGHDYGTIETDGFKQAVVERDGQAVIV